TKNPPRAEKTRAQIVSGTSPMLSVRACLWMASFSTTPEALTKNPPRAEKTRAQIVSGTSPMLSVRACLWMASLT
ncbi:hypothetical protein V5H41_26670, partial [Salmonella enterica]